MGRVVQKLEEVALAVGDQDKAVAWFQDLFGIQFNESWEVPVDSMKVKCARIGDTQFHIVAPTNPNSVIAKFLKERDQGIHHIAFMVNDLDELITRLKEKGVRLIPEIPRVASKSGVQLKYIFVHPKSAYGLLIELIEKR